MNLMLLAQSGKSSIINTINYNEFVESLPSTVEEVSIPPEYTMSQISLLLNDSSSKYATLYYLL